MVKFSTILQVKQLKSENFVIRKLSANAWFYCIKIYFVTIYHFHFYKIQFFNDPKKIHRKKDMQEIIKRVYNAFNVKDSQSNVMYVNGMC